MLNVWGDDPLGPYGYANGVNAIWLCNFYVVNKL